MTEQLPPVPELGRLIRGARKSRQLTLEELAKRSGVSKSLLSQIERGLVNPTFAVAWNLTQALGIDMTRINAGVGDGADDVLIEHLPAYATPVKQSADGKVRLRMLNPLRTVLPVEWYEMRLEPGGALVSSPHAAGTFEHLTCLDGRLRVQAGSREVTCAAGETVRYDADRPHAIHNAAEGESRALLVLALPSQYGGGKRAG